MITDIVVYYSCVPSKIGRNRKQAVLDAFVEGAKKSGLSVVPCQGNHLIPARLAVIIGWVGSDLITAPHIALRQRVIDYQKHTNNVIMPIDANCFKFVDHQSKYLRYSLHNVFYDQADYANSNSDGAHWRNISQDFRINIKPWVTHGSHILILLQRDGGWSLKGFDQGDFLKKTVKTIRQYSDEPILIRPHPGAYSATADWIAAKQPETIFVSDSKKSTLQQDLRNARAVICFNTSASVAAVLEGIPTFVSDSSCVSWSVCNHDITAIMNPTHFDRQQWIYDLSACHWTDEQSAQGQILEKFWPKIQTYQPRT